MRPFPKMRFRRSWLVVGALVGIAMVLIARRWWQCPESTPALRGQALAHQHGCFSCHGPEGRGGVADPGSRGGVVPGWDGATLATLAANEGEVREWIVDGAPTRIRNLTTPGARSLLLPMPAYRSRLSESELRDLLCYVRAISGFGVEISEAAYEGRKVVDRLGCFGCHGPGGIGGAPNPGSFKGHIPAWDGAEFPELVRNEAELREWILDGRVERLWKNPAARHFLEGQIVQMPGYRKYLTDDELAQVLAYFLWLRTGASSQNTGGDDHKVMGSLLLPGGQP